MPSGIQKRSKSLVLVWVRDETTKTRDFVRYVVGKPNETRKLEKL